MTDAQYRCLVAYMVFWSDQPNYSMRRALKDCGIEEARDHVFRQLRDRGWSYDNHSGVLVYEPSDGQPPLKLPTEAH